MSKRLAAITLCAGLLSACGDAAPAETPEEPAVVASVQVATSKQTLELGATVQLEALPRAASGRPIPGRAIAWTTSDGAVATVSGTGLVTARGAGPVVVFATSDGVTGAVDLTVTVSVTVVEIERGGAGPLAVGATERLRAIARAADGRELAGRPMVWTTSAATVAAVSPAGDVTALSAGRAVITATCEGQPATIELFVVPDETVARVEIDAGTALTLAAGAQRQLAAFAYAAGGEAVIGRMATWTTTAADKVGVTAAGLVQAHAAGQATIRATIDGHTAEIVITVSEPTVERLDLSHGDLVLSPGDVLQLSAQPRDAGGQPVDRPVTWESDLPDWVSVDGTGRLVALQEGGASITATSDGVSASLTVLVRPWSEGALLTVDGVAPPAVFGAAPRRVEVSSGRLAFRWIDRQYRLAIAGTLLDDPAGPRPTVYSSEGRYVIGQDGFHLVPVGLDPPVLATVRPDFTIAVTWRPAADLPEATFVFAPVSEQ